MTQRSYFDHARFRRVPSPPSSCGRHRPDDLLPDRPRDAAPAGRPV